MVVYLELVRKALTLCLNKSFRSFSVFLQTFSNFMSFSSVFVIDSEEVLANMFV